MGRVGNGHSGSAGPTFAGRALVGFLGSTHSRAFCLNTDLHPLGRFQERKAAV